MFGPAIDGTSRATRSKQALFSGRGLPLLTRVATDKSVSATMSTNIAATLEPLALVFARRWFTRQLLTY